VYQLTDIDPHVKATLLRTDLKDYEKIAFYNSAGRLFKDIKIDGKLKQMPVVVIDKLMGSPAMIIVVTFITPKLDVASYTFQFECWATDKIQRIPPPKWLPNKVTAIPEVKMKLSFLAERNLVTYFDCAFEGTFKHTLKQMAQVLGR